ncbi:unnamed protein product, partial [marine sediment metagenome]
ENNIYKLMKEKIITTANGNPLFIEEIIRGIEEKKLSADKEKQGNYAEIFADFQIPDTVQSIARARIDLLPVGLKEILYQASVLGRYIETNLFQRITNLKGKALFDLLKELQKYEFIEEIAYHFKNSDDKIKAVFYLNKAGDKSQSLYAFSNAVKYFQYHL